MTLKDIQIDYIATGIMLLIALPILIARLIGFPVIVDLGLETSIIYLPLIVLITLSLYERRRSTGSDQRMP